MKAHPLTVLFLCTGNSARSIIAEAILNTLAPDRVKAYSAGSRPKGAVHPEALDILQHFGVPTDGLHSKSWEAFTGADAPAIDCVITLCDDAAREACPLWPGRPVTVHWGLPDPAATPGSAAARRQAFVETFQTLQQRLAAFSQFPAVALDQLLQTP